MTRKRSGQRGGVSQGPATARQPTGAANTASEPATDFVDSSRPATTTEACQSRPTTPPCTSAVPRAAISPPSRATSPTAASGVAAAAPAAAGSSDAATATGDSAPRTPPQTEVGSAGASAAAPSPPRSAAHSTAPAATHAAAATGPGGSGTPAVAGAAGTPDSTEYWGLPFVEASEAAEAWDGNDPAVRWADLDNDTQDMLLWLQQHMADHEGVTYEALDARVAELRSEGRDYELFPVLCLCVFMCCTEWGPDDPVTISVAFDAVQCDFQQDTVSWPLLCWLLPRAASHPAFGLTHNAVSTAVQYAARLQYLSLDPRKHRRLSRVVFELVQQLPGGLGWGSTVVAPVPDEEAYYQHVVLQAQSDRAFEQGHFKLCIDMLKRCVAYFDTLGQHWLGMPRKVYALRQIAVCVGRAECRLCLASRDVWGISMVWPLQNRSSWRPSVSHRRNWARTMRQHWSSHARKRKETLGPRHIDVLTNQVTTASVLRALGKYEEAEDMAQDAFDKAVRVGGPEHATTLLALDEYARLLLFQNKHSAWRALKKRALKLGVEWDAVVQ